MVARARAALLCLACTAAAARGPVVHKPPQLVADAKTLTFGSNEYKAAVPK